jgi:hypothetical protein
LRDRGEVRGDAGHDLLPRLALPLAKQVGQDTIITHDPNDSVTLHGVALASLSASNFHFA